jgi:hypothetical protein
MCDSFFFIFERTACVGGEFAAPTRALVVFVASIRERERVEQMNEDVKE